MLAHFKEAVTYVRERSALLLAVLTITVVSLLGSSIQQLAPAFAEDVFHVGKSGYGFLIAAFGLGAGDRLGGHRGVGGAVPEVARRPARARPLRGR